MILRIILTIVLIILALIVYLLFIPIAFSAGGDFDERAFRVVLHDPLRFISLRFDTSLDEKFSLRLFYFFKTGGKKKDDEEQKAEKKKKDTGDRTREKGKKKGGLKDFVKKRLKVIIKSIFAFLKICRIHVSDCDVSFSTGEPDSSALIYGGIASLPFMYGKKTHVDVDLMSDDPFVRGHLKISGSIFICILLYYVVKIVVTKGE
jgi:hypothetical protein